MSLKDVHSDPKRVLGDRLISARKMRDLSQYELARRCGLSNKSIYQFEAGNHEPSLSSIRKIALCLEVSVDYLMGIRNQPTGGQVRDSFGKLMENLSAQERNVVRSLVEILITKKNMRNKSYLLDAKDTL